MAEANHIPSYVVDINKEIALLHAESTAKQAKIDSLTEQISELSDRLPETNVISKSFVTRAFAIFGHSLVIQLGLTLIVYICIFVAILGSEF